MAFVEIFDLFWEVPRTDFAGLMERARLRDDEGYHHLEIARVRERYPMLGVNLKNEYAVVQCIEDEESGVRALNGDSSFGEDEVVQFRGPDGIEFYTGRLIAKFAVASEFLKAFALQQPWPADPGWLAL